MRRQCPSCGLKRSVESFGARGKVCAVCRKRSSRSKARYAHLRRTYGIEAEQVDALLAAQDGKCAICGGDREYNLPLDHDHSLPEGPASWRGFLCKRCNKVLRDVRDSIQILEAAAEYLRDPPARKVFAECLSRPGSTAPGASASS